MTRPSFRPETGLPDMDSARFTAEQRFDVLIPQEERFGAVIQDNTHLPRAFYEVEVPPLAQNVLIFMLGPRPVPWDLTISGRARQVTGRPDEILLFPPGVDLRFHANLGLERLVHFHIGPRWLAGLAAEAGLRAPEGRPITEMRDPQVAALFRRMAAGLADNGPLTALAREHVAVLVAVELLRILGLDAQPRRHSLAPARLRAVLAHIEERLGEDVTLADLAAVARLSRFHFARAFRAETGSTPQGFVAQRRIERAKRLMLEEGLPLSHVALACGFAHQAHFTTVFRRLVGTTPGRWRQERLS